MPKLPDNLPAIMFFAEEHAYIRTSDFRKCISMSSVQNKYQPDFEGDYWRKNKAIRDVVGEARWQAGKAPFNLRGMAKMLPPGDLSEQVLASIAATLSPDEHTRVWESFIRYKGEWHLKQAIFARKGTLYHNKCEDRDIAQGGAFNPVTGEWQTIPLYIDRSLCDNHNLVDRLIDLPDGYYPELLVWDWDLMLMGQIDRCWIWTVGGVRYVASVDYKTNFDKSPFSGKGDEGPLTGELLPPFRGVPAVKSSGYAIQQGGYTMILERAGFTPYPCIGLEWIEDFGKGRKMTEYLPYYRDELAEIFAQREAEVRAGNFTMFESVSST